MRLFDDIVEFISYLEFSNYRYPYMLDIYKINLRLSEKNIVLICEIHMPILFMPRTKNRGIQPGMYILI
jgi:hypothetical protein